MKPLAQMGANIEAHEGRFPPLTIHGGAVHTLNYTLPVSAPIKILKIEAVNGELIGDSKFVMRPFAEE